MRLLNVALLFATVVGTVSFNMTSATAGEINLRLKNQQTDISLGSSDNHPEYLVILPSKQKHNAEKRIFELRVRQLRAKEEQIIAEQRLREQQQNVAEQGLRELNSHY